MAFPKFPDPLKPKRTGSAFDFANVNGAGSEKGYFEGPVDQEKLLNALLEQMRTSQKVLKGFYYKDYNSNSYRYHAEYPAGAYIDHLANALVPAQATTRITPRTKIKVPAIVHDGAKPVRLDSVFTRINKKADEDVDADPKYRIHIDTSKDHATYYISFHYVQGTPANSADIIRKTVFLGQDFDVESTQSGTILAIEFSTKNVDHFLLLNKKLDHDFSNLKGYITDKFREARAKIRTGEYKKLNHFYTQAPLFFLAQLKPDILWKDLIGLLLYDIRTFFFDNSDVMIKALTAMIGQDKGTKYLYEHFNLNPHIIKQIYHNLDKNGESMGHGGESVPHKTIFATMLWILSDDHQQWKNDPRRNQTHIRFNITPGHRVDSNIWLDDTYDNKYDLTQEDRKTKRATRNLGGYIDGSVSIDRYTYDPSYWDRGTTHHLHPLDMVTLVLQGPKGKAQELIVPAIFVKDLAYHREWEEVMAIIRLVVNIFIIVVSLVTLIFGNPGPLMTAISVIDLGLATTDITLQAFADEIRKLEGGQEFLDAWESVYVVAGVATGLPLLGNLLKGGAKLLLKPLSAEARTQLVVMLKHALRSTRNFPQFINGQFQIIRQFTTELGVTAGRKMETLAKEGVWLLKGIQEGETVKKYFLSYRDVILRSGSLKKIKDDITAIFKGGEDDVVRYLDDGAGASFKSFSSFDGVLV